MKKVLLEAVLVAFGAALFGFAANGLSPRGLKLARNYFPGDTTPSTTPQPAQVNPLTPGAGTNAADLSEAVTARLKEKGLQVVDSGQAENLFQDPRHQLDSIIFIDARNDEHYQQGHIPRAYQFDHYHPEAYLGTIIPACQRAEQIVVYCNGGDCEDSEHAAISLRDSGAAAKEKLFVYPGGIKDWEAKGRPVESGARGSGQVRGGKP
jgi:rhodanese-related sulfurtransferase